LGDFEWMLDGGDDHYAEIGKILVQHVHRDTARLIGDYFLTNLERSFRRGEEGREAWERFEDQFARWREAAKAVHQYQT
jgi:hypothetical protein